MAHERVELLEGARVEQLLHALPRCVLATSVLLLLGLGGRVQRSLAQLLQLGELLVVGFGGLAAHGGGSYPCPRLRGPGAQEPTFGQWLSVDVLVEILGIRRGLTCTRHVLDEVPDQWIVARPRPMPRKMKVLFIAVIKVSSASHTGTQLTRRWPSILAQPRENGRWCAAPKRSRTPVRSSVVSSVICASTEASSAARSGAGSGGRG
jgi:hypothetical protein